MSALQFPFFHSLLFCAALSFVFPCGAQTTYRWTTGAGAIIYSDQPPPPGTQFEEVKGGARDGGVTLPYVTRLAAEKYPVTLYTAASCKNNCVNARSLLNGRGVPFSEKVITNEEELAEFVKEMGNDSSVPVLKVGSQKIQRFEAGAWNGLLDLAGYPKTAP
jgi:glutaredoxin